MSQKKQASHPQQNAEPIIVWEQKVDRTPDKGDKVVSIDTYRRNGSAFVESEATVTSRELLTYQGQEPLRMIIVSSGFGQKSSRSTNTLQGMAA